MCGIYACAGADNAFNKVFNGLRRLEYRGYDSWGLGWVNDGALKIHKQVGELPEDFEGKEGLGKIRIALGHTRWATQGGVSQVNAHPHLSEAGDFLLAHNGIVENFEELKAGLVGRGKKFVSETDTEVLVKLLEEALTGADLGTALEELAERVEGRNSWVVLLADGGLAGVRRGSPLVIGRGNKEDFYVASDVLSLKTDAVEYLMLENGEEFLVAEGKLRVWAKGRAKRVKFEPMTIDQVDKGHEGYDSYFLKEVMETPMVLRQVAKFEGEGELVELIRAAERVWVVGSGTAGMAAQFMADCLVKVAGIEARSLVGAEAEMAMPLANDKTAVAALSQSGETADVMQFLEQVKEKGAQIVSYVNMPGSMMTRISDMAYMAEAGAEKSVMSSKVFSSQAAWGYLVAKMMVGEGRPAREEILNLADDLESWFEEKKNLKLVEDLARSLLGIADFYLMGVGMNRSIAGEGMIKLIEGAYVHAHAIPAGDLKHYAITLMEPGVKVLALTPADETLRIMKNAVAEVRARGAYVVEIGGKGLGANEAMPLPYSTRVFGLGEVVVMQHLTYYLAKFKSNPVDKPRNIAKSVTVL